jgi:hypothetical protein
MDHNIKLQLSNNDILIELINNQLKPIPNDKKLLYNDLKRICKYIKTSIFTDECSLWYGYITIIKNDEKKSYINFYYAGKKYALHRLLYINFKGELADSEYIKFNCVNKGRCCNINHFYKIKKDDIIDHNDFNKIYYSPIVNNDPTINDDLDTNTELIVTPSQSLHTDMILDTIQEKPINIIVNFNL